MPKNGSDDPRGTPAAETDLLGGRARNSGTLEALQPEPPGAAADGETGDAAPGVDENQAGFLKDADKRDRP